MFLKAHVDAIHVPESGHTSIAAPVATSSSEFGFSSSFASGKKGS